MGATEEAKTIEVLSGSKANGDINDVEVQEKAEVVKKYCEVVTKYNFENNCKNWRMF